MSNKFEVANPIINSPYHEPKEHYWILEGQPAERRQGRRPALYFYRTPSKTDDKPGFAIELQLVNLIRKRLAAWREAGYPGVSRTTLELLQYWRREDRSKHLFFAQVEAVETILFMVEARPDFRQGIQVPRDEPSDDQKKEGFAGFLRYACKMATGSGKTTVMGMLAAWSILNKTADRGDARFSDVVLVVVPNVTIRDRCRELDPALAEASLYRSRDLVPPHLMERMRQGKVLVTNWHVFEPQLVATGDAAKVVKRGREERTTETIRIGDENTTKRGTRWLTRDTLKKQIGMGLVTVKEGDPDLDDVVRVESRRFVESDTALIQRVLGREVGGKKNILVLNDEAHHAYRIRREELDEEALEDLGDEEDAEDFFKEATVWVEGLDRIQKLRGINFCVDLSATPYFLGRMGSQANRPFPWVVSDFSLMDAIESGLVKVPQLAVRDTTGSEIPGYFNIWRWIMEPGRLTAAERGGKKAQPKPEAILKWAHTPVAMLASLWDAERLAWEKIGEVRTPVYILVCKNTALAKVIYDWIAEGVCPVGVPPFQFDSLRNKADATRTIRVDSKVVHESDTGESKSDEVRWMRLTLDTVGKTDWPRDTLGNPIHPEGFAELAAKLKRPPNPPGRDIRCIVSVGMLTEGWDCNTVTHIIGLRPFMSQLLCEQVVGRGLRRTSYEVDEETGLLREEVAKVFGVPFEVVPFKATDGAAPPPPKPRYRVHALPGRAHLRITFPRVVGYTQAIRNRITVDWDTVPSLVIDPLKIPPEVQVKGLHFSETGRPSLLGPGRLDEVSLKALRASRREMEIVFDVARGLTRHFLGNHNCTVPAHVLFPQMARIVQRFLAEKVIAPPPASKLDVHLSPYYGWMIETLLEAIRPDVSAGEAVELPQYEESRGVGSTDEVDFWTTREIRLVNKSHLNAVVADTKQWEQAAAYLIDTHPKVDAFVKNAKLGFGIPYLHNGQAHEYEPDFIIRLKSGMNVILETKGYDPLAEVKQAAAERWVQAVTAEGSHGQWRYAMVRQLGKLGEQLDN